MSIAVKPHIVLVTLKLEVRELVHWVFKGGRRLI